MWASLMLWRRDSVRVLFHEESVMECVLEVVAPQCEKDDPTHTHLQLARRKLHKVNNRTNVTRLNTVAFSEPAV